MFEEYKTMIDGLITNPDTAPANVQSLLEKLQTDLTTLESLKTENEGLNAKVKTLQETNIKLYMSQGNISQEETTQEETVDEDVEQVEAFFNELQGGNE